jgi:uncharacterized protein YjdB
MPQLLSNTQIAKALYNSDRALAGSGAEWSLISNALRATWNRYVVVYKSSNGNVTPGSGGAIPTLGTATRNANFVTLIKAFLPQRFPGRVPGQVSSFTLTPASVTKAALATQQLTFSLEVDANGDAVTGQQYDFTTSDATKGTVNATGLITAVATGTATITAIPRNALQRPTRTCVLTIS